MDRMWVWDSGLPAASLTHTAWRAYRREYSCALGTARAHHGGARTGSRASRCADLWAMTVLLAAAMWAHMLPPVAAAASPKQQVALRDGRHVCGASRKTQHNCIKVLGAADTIADTSTALWMPSSDRKERNVLNVNGNGDDKDRGSALVSLTQLAGLPDQGANVVWLYDGARARARWAKPTTVAMAENIDGRKSHKHGVSCGKTVAWCVVPEELVEQFFNGRGIVPT